jgi:hypothetical protein
MSCGTRCYRLSSGVHGLLRALELAVFELQAQQYQHRAPRELLSPIVQPLPSSRLASNLLTLPCRHIYVYIQSRPYTPVVSATVSDKQQLAAPKTAKSNHHQESNIPQYKQTAKVGRQTRSHLGLHLGQASVEWMTALRYSITK